NSFSLSPMIPGWVAPGAGTFWWEKLNLRPSVGTPRKRSKVRRETLAPMFIRRGPMVCARSAKIGPKLVVVATGTPVEKSKVRPDTVELSGKLERLEPIKVGNAC